MGNAMPALAWLWINSHKDKEDKKGDNNMTEEDERFWRGLGLGLFGAVLLWMIIGMLLNILKVI